MRLYRSRYGLAGAQEGYSRRCSDRLDEPSQAIPRHGSIPAEPAAVSPGKIIVPRIVIGGVILDHPERGLTGGCGADGNMLVRGEGRRKTMNFPKKASAYRWSGFPQLVNARPATAEWLQTGLLQ
jgi:hypothetical protein